MERIIDLMGWLMMLAGLLFLVALVLVLFIVVVAIVIGAAQSLAELLGGKENGRDEGDV